MFKQMKSLEQNMADNKTLMEDKFAYEESQREVLE